LASQRRADDTSDGVRTLNPLDIRQNFPCGRDGFWLARWLRAHQIEAYVIHPSSVPVSRKHRRAKTDRLDTELLKRAFLGWLRGEDEDAKRPSRERLVSECTRIVNRLRANLARLGIRGLKLTLARALERLTALRTPEGAPLPANTLAEMRRDLARLQFVKEQIKEIERARAVRASSHRKRPPPEPRGWRRHRDGGHACSRGLLP
jgi:transposase